MGMRSVRKRCQVAMTRCTVVWEFKVDATLKSINCSSHNAVLISVTHKRREFWSAFTQVATSYKSLCRHIICESLVFSSYYTTVVPHRNKGSSRGVFFPFSSERRRRLVKSSAQTPSICLQTLSRYGSHKATLSAVDKDDKQRHPK